MSATLYRKYRPQGWSDVAGQEHVKETLSFEVASGRTVHAYLFSGPRGVGKTTMARIFAKAVNCLKRAEDSGEPCGKCEACLAVSEGGSLDIIEIDAASNRGIDSVRDNIIESARFAPARLKNKVFIIDEVHMLTTEAFNALLKTLEEPPDNVVFLLATTELHKVPATVASRCQRFDFRKIPVEAVIGRLEMIAKSEGIEIESAVLAEIARQTEGCLRDAEGLLGKVLSAADGDRVTVESVQTVLPRSDWEVAASLVDAFLSGDASSALAVVGGLLDQGIEPERLTEEVIELLRKILVAKVSGNVEFLRSELDEARLERVSGWLTQASPTQLVYALERLLEKRRDMKGSTLPQLPLELAAVLICREMAGETDEPVRPVKRVAPPTGAVQPVRAAVVKPVVVKRVVEPEDKQPVAKKPVEQPEEKSVAKGEAIKPEEKTVPAEKEPAPVEAVEKKAEEEASAEVAETSEVTEEKEPAGEPIEFGQVQARWGEVVQQATEASQSMSLLLGAVKLVRMDGETLELGSSFPFYRDRISDDKVRRQLEDVLKSVFGRKLLLRAVTLEKKDDLGHNDVAAESPAPAKPVEASSGVQQIADAFGGHVVS